MNKFYINLADKAGFNIESGEIYGDVSEPINDELMTYTELVLQECVDIILSEITNTNALMTMPPRSSAIWNARNEINARFGVKL